MASSADNLIWIDLEMTGLDPLRDQILEIATIVTDKQLVVLAEGPVIAIHQADEVLASMDAWNTRTHTQSGLVARVRASTIDTAGAQRRTLLARRERPIVRDPRDHENGDRGCKPGKAMCHG